MNFSDHFRGTMVLRITGAEPEKTLQEIAVSGVSVSRISKITDLVSQIRISRSDFHKIQRIVRSRGDSLAIVRKQGFYWHIRAFLGRYVLISVIIVLLLLTLFLPTRILFIETEGNSALSDASILSAAENCGISFGVSRKRIRSEKTKNALLSALPQLQWAGVNTAGCRAVISVRERAATQPPSEQNTVSSIVARQDAYVLSVTATAGTALVHPGDSVTAGQTLISGYSDHGIALRAQRAEGEILGLTGRSLTAVMPADYRQITAQRPVTGKISLLIRKKRINLWKDSRISDATCGRMYTEYFVSLPGGFQLPVAICVDRYVCYQTSGAVAEESDVRSDLEHFSDGYLTGQMTAGQILQKHRFFSCAEGVYQLSSSYTCSEIIGREQREEIGDHNGKRY